MELNEYQKRAMETCMPSCENFSYMMLNLVGEVGELIEMLMAIKAVRLCIDNEYDHRSLIVKRLLDGKWDILYGNVGQELVDLLFDAILKLKEEGVI